MKELKSICIIAEHYPTKEEPLFPFAQQLAYSLSNIGVKCNIIAPQSLTRSIVRRKTVQKTKDVDITPDGYKINVYRPYTITFSNKYKFLHRIANFFMRRAIVRGIKQVGRCDCVYSYFWHVGLTVARALRHSEVPMFVQASECELTIFDFMLKEEYLNKISGVVCASGKNKAESLEAGLVKEDDTRVIVNGYRPDEFYEIDKVKVRNKLNFPKDAFIVGFVGSYISRKGISQLCKAIDRFEDVYSFFIGTGPIEPQCKNILYKGTMPHNELVTYLNAADIFALPTNAEGCCNAIIEALACGLPVVSSKKSFNDEILDENCSLRIDESSVDEIYDAIYRLKEDIILRKKMSENALKKSENLTIDFRANAIKKFIESRI